MSHIYELEARPGIFVTDYRLNDRGTQARLTTTSTTFNTTPTGFRNDTAAPVAIESSTTPTASLSSFSACSSPLIPPSSSSCVFSPPPADLDALSFDLDQVQNSIDHLYRSNTELKQYLSEDPNEREYSAAIEENKQVILKKEVEKEKLQRQIAELTGSATAQPTAPASAPPPTTAPQNVSPTTPSLTDPAAHENGLCL